MAAGPDNVLVVTINYSPEHAGIAPYATQASEFFTAQGHCVNVLAGIPHYPQWSAAPGYRGLRFPTTRVNGVEVHRLRHFVPRKQTAARRALYELTFGLQVWRRARRQEADVILAVVPSLLGAAAASRVARRSNARFVVWVQDLMAPAAAQTGVAGGASVSPIVRAIESRVLRAADEVVVITDAFRQYVLDQGVDPSRVTVCSNWSHVADATSERQRMRRSLGWADDEVIVLHSGNMGFKQGLENVVDAARLADERGEGIRFVLMGDGSQRTKLEARSRHVQRLDLLPPADGDAYPDILAAADVLLVNERSAEVDMSLPSKLTSYFTSGNPVIAAVPQGGGTATEVQRSGAGVVVEADRPLALLDAALDLGLDAARRLELGAHGRTFVAKRLDAATQLTKLEASVLGSDSLTTASRQTLADA